MDKIKVNLFGYFSMSLGERRVTEDTLKSKKLMNLLSYLIVFRDQMLTQQKLIEHILDEDTKNPENTLRNLMYRLRNELKSLGEYKFICTSHGAYQWNPQIEIETDYGRFEKLTDELQHMAEHRESKTEHASLREKCEEVIGSFEQNVTPKLENELWMLPRVVKYESIYLDTVKLLCEIYEEEKSWLDLEHLCHNALEKDIYDEDLHCWLIRSLYRQKRPEQAMNHYTMAKKIFYEHLGVRETQKLQAVYREMLSDRDDLEETIEHLVRDMRETENLRGSYFCDYQVFRLLYQVEVRRNRRLGISEYMLLLTVRRSNDLRKNSMTDSNLLEAVEELESVVMKSLRTGDVATRSSATQILILLPGCTFENCNIVIERIRKAFKGHIAKRQIELTYELEEITDDREA
ncbi:MAG: BTAD domain-containing putative transcriptional regulator [Eubacteriales bacterium]|nr:BTAD domain-containing putative transcriptional regulator [Eubacteriales bacterium]